MFVTSTGPSASHTYACSANNVYTVRVEITDYAGNRTVASQEVDVSASCLQEPETIRDLFLPFIQTLLGGQ